MSKLIYCATPSRLVHRLDDIMDFVTNEGNAPLHPFQAFPFERYEGNPMVGRIKSMEYCLRLIDISDEFYMFGVSEGTLEEVSHAIKINKPIKLQFDSFDPEWEKFYQELGPKYGDPIDNLLKKNTSD
ncbi:MAG: hypothetical protein ABIB43_06765 [archaeon]